MSWHAANGRRATAPGPDVGRLGLAIVAILLVALFSVRHENFLTAGNAEAVGVNVAAIAIAGVGAMILLITGYIDLSIGGMYALIGMIVAQVASRVEDATAAAATGLACGLVLGLVNGVLVRLLKISPLIVTIGLMTVYAGAAYVVSADFVYGFPDEFLTLGRGSVAGIPIPVLVAAGTVGVGGFILTRTVLGLHLYAMGGDARAAERSGVRVERLILGAYACNGVLVGIAAVLTTAQLGSGTPDLGVNFQFDVLTAVILGGVAFNGGAGRPFGVVLGVVTIGILNAGLLFEGLQHWWQDIAKGGILLLALGADQFSAWRRARRVVSESSKEHAAAGVRRDVENAELAQDEGVEPVGTFDTSVVLVADEVSKSYGAVQALHPSHLTIQRGEVVALLGDNGAGKSTLTKIISGAVRPDTGSLMVDGKDMHFREPADARAAGIETVYQDLALCPNLSVTHNFMLGKEPTRRLWGIIRVRDDRIGRAAAIKRLSRLRINLQDVSILVDGLSGGQRQAIAIARALDDHVNVVCLDEPTAALGVTQTANVLELARSTADHGTGVLMITHDVSAVMKVCDRVVVLRHGSVVHSGATSELSELELLQLMAGLEPDRAGQISDARLEATRIASGP